MVVLARGDRRHEDGRIEHRIHLRPSPMSSTASKLAAGRLSLPMLCISARTVAASALVSARQCIPGSRRTLVEKRRSDGKAGGVGVPGSLARGPRAVLFSDRHCPIPGQAGRWSGSFPPSVAFGVWSLLPHSSTPQTHPRLPGPVPLLRARMPALHSRPPVCSAC
jgi:hypothetical protein